MNSSFSKSIPTLQLGWDSTSLKALLKCPRYYQLTIIEGWTPRSQNADLRFGILYHGALERYDHARAEGQDQTSATRIALRYALEQTWERDLNRPWISDNPNKNRMTLIRTIVWYLDQFGEADPIKTVVLANGKPAVELSFQLQLDYKSQLTGEDMQYCGHLDRLGEAADQNIYILDRKTTKHTLDDTYFEGFTPDPQFTGYIFSGKIVYELPIRGIIADAAQVMVNGSRFERRQIARTQDQLDEWHRGLGYWLTSAQLHARANFWPMNDAACFRCHFRGICSKPQSTREDWLRAGFVKREWDPLKARGDI